MSGILTKQIRIGCLVIFALLHAFCFLPDLSARDTSSYRYAVVISSGAYSDAGWRAVADSLILKHGSKGKSRIFTWQTSVNDVKSGLCDFGPDYIGYIARPETECNSAFVVAVSRLSRQLDDDPYGDAVWGIITGFEAADAMRAISESLTVKTVLCASGNLSCEPPIQRFYQAVGMTCDDVARTDYLFPDRSGRIYTENRRPYGEQDRIKIVSRWLNEESLDFQIAGQGSIRGPIDCIITGGHGNVNLWQCHYPEPDIEGYMRSSAGRLFGSPYSGDNISISVPTPKVFWCLSNCLMGNPDSKNNIVYAAFHTGHAVQMFGFVNNAAAGNEFMAWGIYDRVTKSAGKYTLPEGFFLSNNNAQFELRHPTGQMNTSQVKIYMDSTVFYGDPAGDVCFHAFGDTAKGYKEELTFVENGSGGADFTYTVTMVAHDLEFGVGYCYQFRPISMLPVRIDPSTVSITGNDGHTADITDNLLVWEMLSRGEKLQKGRSRTLKWTAKLIDDITGAVRGVSEKPAVNKMNIVSFKNGTQTLLRGNPVLEDGATLRLFDNSGRLLCKSKIPSGNSFWQVRVPNVSVSGVVLVVMEKNGAVLCRDAVMVR